MAKTKRASKIKNLIIVESPAKARTIKNFLGDGYEVIASKGHIRDLPKKSFGISIDELGITPVYTVSPEHSEVIRQMKELYRSADTTYIATDEDREGEAIGYHIVETLGGDVSSFPRIVFHEITKDAIVKSLQNARCIDMDKVNAQQARRLLDRIVGFKLSPLISSKIRNGLSAGRVQSSTLKILVDREREIRSFKPDTYYMFEGKDIASSSAVFELASIGQDKVQKCSITDKAKASEILTMLRGDTYTVTCVQVKERAVKPPPPFMTSTLQQSSSSVLGYSPTKTMSIAQRLYEGVRTPAGLAGVITYMRTDSLHIAAEALHAARQRIESTMGKKYLPSKPNVYVAKSSQEAHEAIRPTDIAFTPEVAKGYLKDDELRLYTLIYNRFMASQMSNSVFESMSVSASGDRHDSVFKINGRKLVFDGFYKILGGEAKDVLLRDYKEGQKLGLDISMLEKVTEPPSRFSEAGLIKMMESLGIGRPSTYAPTIRLLVERDYIQIQKKQIMVSDVSFSVTELLESNFNDIVDSSFSAEMETKLDSIMHRDCDWQDVLRRFYDPFVEKVNMCKKDVKSQKVLVPTGELCPVCGHDLVKRVGRYGEFVSCSGYPSCRYVKRDAPVIEKSDEVCDKCGGDMVYRTGRNGRFLACSNYPTCKNTKPCPADKVEMTCPKCGGNVVMRRFRSSTFYGCSNYPKCDFTSKSNSVRESSSLQPSHK